MKEKTIIQIAGIVILWLVGISFLLYVNYPKAPNELNLDELRNCTLIEEEYPRICRDYPLIEQEICSEELKEWYTTECLNET